MPNSTALKPFRLELKVLIPLFSLLRVLQGLNWVNEGVLGLWGGVLELRVV